MGRKEVLSLLKKNDITLLIPKSLTGDAHFSNYAIATYCVLQALYVPTQLGKGCITPQQIAYFLTDNMDCFKRKSQITNHIQCGLDELLENNIISKIDEYQKYYILDCSNLWIDTENDYFSRITFEDVKKIFQVKGINNFLLLRFYITLIGTVSNTIKVYLVSGDYKSSVVGNLTIDYLAELSGISNRSVIDYSRILEEIGLLYVYRHEDFTLNGEEGIRRLANVYGRPSDKEYIDTFAVSQQKHKDSYRYRESNIEKANSKRRLAQMYQQLLKGKGEKYTKSDIIEIYNYVISENEKYERMYEKDKYEEYLDKIRDTDVFEKYDFIPKETEK